MWAVKYKDNGENDEMAYNANMKSAVWAIIWWSPIQVITQVMNWMNQTPYNATPQAQ